MQPQAPVVPYQKVSTCFQTHPCTGNNITVHFILILAIVLSLQSNAYHRRVPSRNDTGRLK